MKTKTKFFHCGEQLQKTIAKEINDVESVVRETFAVWQDADGDAVHFTRK